MFHKWKCLKCKSFNTSEKTRCSFCSQPRPTEEALENRPSDADIQLHGIKQQLHQHIERLTIVQCNKLMRYMEDNII